jgi:hypothetical protein
VAWSLAQWQGAIASWCRPQASPAAAAPLPRTVCDRGLGENGRQAGPQPAQQRAAAFAPHDGREAVDEATVLPRSIQGHPQPRHLEGVQQQAARRAGKPRCEERLLQPRRRRRGRRRARGARRAGRREEGLVKVKGEKVERLLRRGAHHVDGVAWLRRGQGRTGQRGGQGAVGGRRESGRRMDERKAHEGAARGAPGQPTRAALTFVQGLPAVLRHERRGDGVEPRARGHAAGHRREAQGLQRRRRGAADGASDGASEEVACEVGGRRHGGIRAAAQSYSLCRCLERAGAAAPSFLPPSHSRCPTLTPRGAPPPALLHDHARAGVCAAARRRRAQPVLRHHGGVVLGGGSRVEGAGCKSGPAAERAALEVGAPQLPQKTRACRCTRCSCLSQANPTRFKPPPPPPPRPTCGSSVKYSRNWSKLTARAPPVSMRATRSETTAWRQRSTQRVLGQQIDTCCSDRSRSSGLITPSRSWGGEVRGRGRGRRQRAGARDGSPLLAAGGPGAAARRLRRPHCCNRNQPLPPHRHPTAAPPLPPPQSQPPGPASPLSNMSNASRSPCSRAITNDRNRRKPTSSPPAAAAAAPSPPSSPLPLPGSLPPRGRASRASRKGRTYAVGMPWASAYARRSASVMWPCGGGLGGGRGGAGSGRAPAARPPSLPPRLASALARSAATILSAASCPRPPTLPSASMDSNIRRMLRSSGLTRHLRPSAVGRGRRRARAAGAVGGRGAAPAAARCRRAGRGAAAATRQLRPGARAGRPRAARRVSAAARARARAPDRAARSREAGARQPAPLLRPLLASRLAPGGFRQEKGGGPRRKRCGRRRSEQQGARGPTRREARPHVVVRKWLPAAPRGRLSPHFLRGRR